MKNALFQHTYVPEYMLCSCHEEPELNYILHYKYPKFLVETSEEYDKNDLDELTKKKAIFKEVDLGNGEKDLICLVDLLDKDFINGKTDKQIRNELMAIMNDMAKWYVDELADLDSYGD